MDLFFNYGRLLAFYIYELSLPWIDVVLHIVW